MEALWEAIGIVLAVSFISLGVRAGAVVACSIPLVLAAVFVGMELTGIDLQRVSLRLRVLASAEARIGRWRKIVDLVKGR